MPRPDSSSSVTVMRRVRPVLLGAWLGGGVLCLTSCVVGPCGFMWLGGGSGKTDTESVTTNAVPGPATNVATNRFAPRP